MDPVQDGMNWYVYVNNNPLNSVDPTGLEKESLFNRFKNVVSSYGAKAKEALTDTKTGGVGFNFNVGAVYGGGLTAQITFDQERVGFLFSAANAVMAPELSLTVQGTITSCDTMYDQAGLAAEAEVGGGEGYVLRT